MGRGGWGGQGLGRASYERFLEPGGRLVTEDKASTQARLVEVKVEFQGQGYCVPAYLDGPPEDCYPEDREVEVTDVHITSVTRSGRQLLQVAYRPSSFELTRSEEVDAEVEIEESIKNGDLL